MWMKLLERVALASGAFPPQLWFVLPRTKTFQLTYKHFNSLSTAKIRKSLTYNVCVRAERSGYKNEMRL